MSEKTPHDGMFKFHFEKRHIGLQFFQAYLPPDIVRNIQWESLQLEDRSYIDEELKNSFSDIVYQCNYGEKLPLILSLLLEHKSHPISNPYPQLLRYISRIWDRNLAEKEPLRLVIPIIFYHGPEAWNYREMGDYFPGMDEHLKIFLPSFLYHLVDLSHYSDGSIIDNDLLGEQLKITLLLMKKVFQEVELVRQLTDIFAIGDYFHDLEDEEKVLILISMIIYLYKTTRIDKDVLRNALSKISPKGGELALTTAEKLRKEGLEQGMEKANRENAIKMIREKADFAFIQRITGLSFDELTRLQEKIDCGEL